MRAAEVYKRQNQREVRRACVLKQVSTPQTLSFDYHLAEEQHLKVDNSVLVSQRSGK